MNPYPTGLTQDPGETPDDQNLHIQAGLVCTGMDDEGEIEYIGTRQQWDKYQELYDAE